MKTTAEILIEARKLIEKPENWTQGVDARDSRGIAVDYDHGGAVCWCAAGAISRIGKMSDAVGDAERTMRLAIGFGFISSFNDSRTHAEVLAAFDRAIEAAKHLESRPSTEGKSGLPERE